MLSLIACSTCSIKKARQKLILSGFLFVPLNRGLIGTAQLLIIVGVWRFDRILFEQGFGTRAQDEW